MRGWLTFPLIRGFRLGISPSRSWLSFPLFGGIRRQAEPTPAAPKVRRCKAMSPRGERL
jgi:hypothetical protein